MSAPLSELQFSPLFFPHFFSRCLLRCSQKLTDIDTKIPRWNSHRMPYGRAVCTTAAVRVTGIWGRCWCRCAIKTETKTNINYVENAKSLAKTWHFISMLLWMNRVSFPFPAHYFKTVRVCVCVSMKWASFHSLAHAYTHSLSHSFYWHLCSSAMVCTKA